MAQHAHTPEVVPASPLFSELREQLAERRAARKARRELERELAHYSSAADRLELDAILSRHSIEETAEIRHVLAVIDAKAA
ncbi:hypothetical protein SAMN05892883_3686 [Jatrophihabitans sp. GAS493]|uniref:hypothetical protein n=1 Tax=Jatrophihabitans sp. GAS493 TaxID=1907575 RepID=UPI000BBF6FF1|nr:hypothetical protein [Jatrophihabitans sp. GAS493]SOD74500.1 hypothetical protein SAMN05892883_3686 [Jatrophihabitans sp. GAS493]